MRMPGLDGLGLLRDMRERGLETPVVMLTAHGTVESAVEAMKLGAVDYILRPFEMSTVELAVTRALAMGEVQRENRFLRDEVGRGWGEFVGQGEAMTRLYALVQQVAGARSSVFIVGETGTGKELVARAIHQQSGRTGLFVPYNCAAIPAELLEGELFGSRKGAFTGADRDRVGRFEASSGGTIFLDEVTEMPVGLQGKLLRVLQEGVVERLGTQVPIALDLRVVAATNRDPGLAMAEGRLRADLYYRLNVVRVEVPPLRERREDIPLLAEHFLARYSRELGRRPPRLAAETLALLRTYAWPGNVRELQNLMERAAVLARGRHHRSGPASAGVVGCAGATGGAGGAQPMRPGSVGPPAPGGCPGVAPHPRGPAAYRRQQVRRRPAAGDQRAIPLVQTEEVRRLTGPSRQPRLLATGQQGSRQIDPSAAAHCPGGVAWGCRRRLLGRGLGDGRQILPQGLVVPSQGVRAEECLVQQGDAPGWRVPGSAGRAGSGCRAGCGARPAWPRRVRRRGRRRRRRLNRHSGCPPESLLQGAGRRGPAALGRRCGGRDPAAAAVAGAPPPPGARRPGPGQGRSGPRSRDRAHGQCRSRRLGAARPSRP